MDVVVGEYASAGIDMQGVAYLHLNVALRHARGCTNLTLLVNTARISLGKYSNRAGTARCGIVEMGFCLAGTAIANPVDGGGAVRAG